MLAYQNYEFDSNAVEVVQKMVKSLQLTLTTGNNPEGNVCFAQNEEVRPEYKEVVSPIEIIDYCYAIYHSSEFRHTKIAFQKLDLLEFPLPTNNSKFWKMVNCGAKLRRLFSEENIAHEQITTQFPIEGNNKVITAIYINSPLPEGGVEDELEILENLDPMKEAKLQYFIIKDHKIPHNTITRLPYNPRLKSRVKELRYAENLPEVLFWMQVHKSHFYKIDFDRQKIIGNYIVDFYVKKLGLVFEIDGSSHDGKEMYDEQRDQYLQSLGLKVLHIPAIEVLQMMAKVMTDVEDFIIENYGERYTTQNPPRPTGTPPVEGNGRGLIYGKVFINETQYFDNVPEQVWNFTFGTEQYAKKWLLDRKGTELTPNAILDYQRLVFKLIEMTKIIEEIDFIQI
jgi:very-short-patch-repair endonuclease